MKTAIDAIELSEELVRDWLGSCMFDSSKPDEVEKINKIVTTLNAHDSSKAHGRHFDADFCSNAGLKILMMETKQELQDKILSLHHAYMISIDALPVAKIIESQNGRPMMSTIPMMR